MSEPLFPALKSPRYPLNEAEWTLESVWMLFGEKKISARDSTVVPQLVQFTVTIMITVSGSILGNLLLTELIQPPGKNGWRKLVEIFYKDTSNGRRRRTHRKMEGPIHS